MIEIPEDPQVVFDIVAEHLLKQNERSENEDHICLYRGPRGLKCAVGCLIPDDKYNSIMENTPWDILVDCEIVPSINSVLIRKLQVIHDIFAPKDWLDKLYELADELKLNTCVLIEIKSGE